MYNPHIMKRKCNKGDEKQKATVNNNIIFNENVSIYRDDGLDEVIFKYER